MKKSLIFIKNKFNIFFKKINNFSNNYSEPLPIYLDNKEPGLKVHLGSGEINLQGWINVDARKFKHTHIIDQDFELKEFNDESISEIYLCHVLEHFSFNDSNVLIKKLYKIGCRNLLVEGGDILSGSFLEDKIFNQFYLFKSKKILNKSTSYTGFNNIRFLIQNYKTKSKINTKLGKDTITLYKR